MLTIESGTGESGRCDAGSGRRTVLQAGAGLLGMSLAGDLTARAAHAGVAQPTPRARSVIFLLLFGGPSQLESFDLKPDAPEAIRGPFSPIACKTPGLLISEHYPRLAALSDQYCVVRTMTHDFNDHSGGGHYLQTGKRWHVPIGGGFNATPSDWPSVGSVVQRLSGHTPGGLPAYAVLPNRLGRLEDRGQYLRPGEYAGWLGKAHDPFTTTVDKRSLTDNPYWREMSDEELTFQIAGQSPRTEVRLDRLDRRRTLLEQLDEHRRRLESSATAVAYEGVHRRALDVVCSDAARTALNLKAEAPAVRDRYGRHLFGQSCLMARRLVEAGVRYVTVHYEAIDGYSWDSHRNSDDVKRHLMPTTDQAVSALLEDLRRRGLLSETLVVLLGEMGRTPKANAQWGRDHWSTLFPALLAGGGIRGGAVYGRSDAQAAFPEDDPVRPEDLAATLYWALGIDPGLTLTDTEGRPTRVVQDGEPIRAIFG